MMNAAFSTSPPSTFGAISRRCSDCSQLRPSKLPWSPLPFWYLIDWPDLLASELDVQHAKSFVDPTHFFEQRRPFKTIAGRVQQLIAPLLQERNLTLRDDLVLRGSCVEGSRHGNQSDSSQCKALLARLQRLLKNHKVMLGEDVSRFSPP